LLCVRDVAVSIDFYTMYYHNQLRTKIELFIIIFNELSEMLLKMNCLTEY